MLRQVGRSRRVRASLLGLAATVLALGLVSVVSALPAAAPAAGSDLLRWAYVVAWEPSSNLSLRANIDRIDYVSPFWFGIDGKGQITRNDHDAGLMQFMRTRGKTIVPTVKNTQTGNDFGAMLRTPEARAASVGRVIELVERYGYDGIHIDYEDLAPADRANLTAWQTELWQRLKPKGKLVTMTINAKTRERFDGFAGAHDYGALGAVNDLVLVQAYGYKVAGSNPGGPGAPIEWVDAVTAYAVSAIPKDKLILGLPWYGFTWNVTKGPPAASISYEGAAGLAQRFNGQMGYDTTTQTPFLRYTRDGDQFEAWFEDQRSIDAKVAVARKYGVRGVGGWRLGHEDPAMWKTWPGSAVASAPAPSPSPSPTPAPAAVPPPSGTYWQRGYPERGAEGCTWYVAAWSDGSYGRAVRSCPAGVNPAGTPIAGTYPEIGTDGCTWYVTRFANGAFSRVPFSCPSGRFAMKPAVAPTGSGVPAAPTPGAAGVGWQRGYAELGTDRCTWYVAAWRDGSYTRVPWNCPAGVSARRPGTTVAVDRSYPEAGREGCVWYVTRWSDGAHTRVPFRCSQDVAVLKP